MFLEYSEVIGLVKMTSWLFPIVEQFWLVVYVLVKDEIYVIVIKKWTVSDLKPHHCWQTTGIIAKQLLRGDNDDEPIHLNSDYFRKR